VSLSFDGDVSLYPQPVPVPHELHKMGRFLSIQGCTLQLLTLQAHPMRSLPRSTQKLQWCAHLRHYQYPDIGSAVFRSFRASNQLLTMITEGAVALTRSPRCTALASCTLPFCCSAQRAQIGLAEFFDFANMPWKTPPIPPSQPTSGPCHVNRLP